MGKGMGGKFECSPRPFLHTYDLVHVSACLLLTLYSMARGYNTYGYENNLPAIYLRLVVIMTSRQSYITGRGWRRIRKERWRVDPFRFVSKKWQCTGLG